MAEPAELPPAKALLLATKFTTDSNIPALRTLAAIHADTFRLRLILRLLLTFLPESTSPSLYVPFVQELASGSRGWDGAVAELDCSSVEDISDAEARKRARRLHLVDLSATPIDWQPPPDDITLFLISRAHRIDAQTGLLTLLPQLIAPFLNHSEYLHTWFISTVLPLLRLSYVYYPQEGAAFSLAAFGKLSDETGVAILLGRTIRGGTVEKNEKTRVGRDLRGLVGPWMCGATRNRRREPDGASSDNVPSVHGTKSETQEHSQSAWSYVFQWIVDMAATEFPLVVEAIEQWDGPGDVDLGDYGGGQLYVDEDLQAHAEKQYAQSAIAATLSTTDTSAETFEGVQRILVRIASLMDVELPSFDLISSTSHLPTLSPPFAISTSISLLHLSRNNLLHMNNPITTPTEGLLSLLNVLTLSASILGNIGHGLPLVRIVELYLFGSEGDQRGVLQRVLHSVSGSSKRDKKVWRRLRHEIMWLWGWGTDNPSASNGKPRKGHGLLGKVGYDVLEVEMLKALLNDARELPSSLRLLARCRNALRSLV
jgi:protein transport protein SEC39